VTEEDRRDIDTIVVLEVVGQAERIAPISLESTSFAFQKKASTNNVFQAMAEYGPDKARDGDPGTRWATDAGTGRACLEVDLGEPRTFNRVRI